MYVDCSGSSSEVLAPFLLVISVKQQLRESEFYSVLSLFIIQVGVSIEHLAPAGIATTCELEIPWVCDSTVGWLPFGERLGVHTHTVHSYVCVSVRVCQGYAHRKEPEIDAWSADRTIPENFTFAFLLAATEKQ